MPAVDCGNVLKWLFFNLYTGNNDSHAKNLSMLSDQNNGMRLAPFYDLMCTKVYSGLSINFAFKIGSNYQLGLIGKNDIAKLASDIGVKEKFIFEVAADMAERITECMPLAANELRQNLAHSEKIIVERIMHNVLSNTKKLQAKILFAGNEVAGNEVSVDNDMNVVDTGFFSGSVLKIEGDVLVQRIGREDTDVVRHSLLKLGEVGGRGDVRDCVKAGDMIDVRYGVDGVGVVEVAGVGRGVER